ncbi:hypothetical protein Tco_0708807 [Tanacetum coccineum]
MGDCGPITKSGDFNRMRETDPLDKLARFVLKGGGHETLELPVSLIVDRDPRFAIKFLESLPNALGTNLV